MPMEDESEREGLLDIKRIKESYPEGD